MKKYTHRDQILKDIDRAHAKIKRLEKDAQSWLDEEQLYKGTSTVSELRNARENADKFLKAIKYQKERRLKYLGEKLAEMDTMPLPGITPSHTAPEPTPEPSAKLPDPPAA